MKKEKPYINLGGGKSSRRIGKARRSVSLLMAVVLLFFALPLENAAFKAEEPNTEIVYREYDTEKGWDIKYCSEYQMITASDDTLAEGWYVVKGEVTCSKKLTVNGNVHLILTDDCLLAASDGIYVTGGNSITIYAQSDGESMGKLEAISSDANAAGIGGSWNGNGANITINGGKVTATAKIYGAGIGGGKDGNGENITINGGTVTATGGIYAAGIGGGNDGSGENITINGGTVIAIGGTFAAGIGGGKWDGNGTNITINGGEVTATGGDYGAGIGGSRNGNGANITINGGKVTATGKIYGAGIGGGDGGNGENITINNGTVTATGGTFGAGIGGGDEGVGSNITINNGTVTADGQYNSAGIGGGHKAAGSNITINGGIVTAKGDSGIGGGSFAEGSYIMINDGIVDAAAFNGAGIGGGNRAKGSYITINDGIVDATAFDGAGIGGGYRADGSHITINGGKVKAVGEGAGIGGSGVGDFSANGSHIFIKDAEVEASSSYEGAGIGGSGYFGIGSDISITNSRVTANGSLGPGYNNGSGSSGIGSGGYGGSGIDISITDSYVTTSGGQNGIGGGRDGKGENISIQGSIVRASSKNKAYIGGGEEGQSINITKENSIIFEGNEGTVYNEAVLNEKLLGEDIKVEVNTDETLTVPEDASLLLKGTLINKGIFTIHNEGCLSSEGGLLGGEGQFFLENAAVTADDIIVPEGMVYNGEDQTDSAEKASGLRLTGDTKRSICGVEFTVKKFHTDEWQKSIHPAEVKNAGTYSVVYTKKSDSTAASSKDFTVAQSAVTYNDNVENTTLKSYEGSEEKTQFTYGGSITIKVTPRLSGTAAQFISDGHGESIYQQPAEGEIAVFMQKNGTEIQLTEAKAVTSGSEVSFDINTLEQGLTPDTYTLSVRYKGTKNLADYSEDIGITVVYHQAADAVLEGTKGQNGWYLGPVTVQAPQGYLISSQNTKEAVWSSSIAAKDLSLDENGDYVYFLKEASEGYLTDKMTLAAVKVDAVKPEFGGFTYTEGKAGTEIFVKVWNWLVGKDYITVTVPITEAESGLDKDSIQVSLTNPDGNTAGTAAEEISLTKDTEGGYMLSFLIPVDFDGFCSVTVTDTAGNEGISGKQRVVIDTASPRISINLNGAPYNKENNIFTKEAMITISVDDDLDGKISAGLASVGYCLDGNSVSLEPEGGFDGTEEDFWPVLRAETEGEGIKINEKGTHTLLVRAEDHAGNITEEEISFQIYYPTNLVLSEKTGEPVIYDKAQIEAGTDFLVVREGSEEAAVYSYQCLDSEDNSCHAGLPTDSGKYKIKVEIPQDNENFYFGTEAELELTIQKAQVEAASYTKRAVKQKKHDITYDLSVLLPKEVEGKTVYSILNINNQDGVLSDAALPSVGVLSGSVLALSTEAVEDVGKRAELTISFTNDNYEISNAVFAVEITDKIQVTISGIAISEAEQSKLLYNGSAASWSGAPKAETEDGESVNLAADDYQYCWYQLEGNKYIEIPNNAPPADAGNYKLVVKGENSDYLGTQEIPFEIVKRDISDAVITLGDNLIFNGMIQTQTLASVKSGSLLLTEEDYTVTENTGCHAAAYTLTITGTGNFTGTAKKEFTIAPLPVKLLWNVQTFTYDGEAHGVSASVSNAVNGYEVSVSAYNNESAVNAGTYTAKAAELDNPNYTLKDGTNLSAEYCIERLDITGKTDLEILLGDSLTYNGAMQTQKISSVTLGALEVEYQASGNTGTNAGKYTLTVTGTGNFTGTAEKEFVILQAENAPDMPEASMKVLIENGKKIEDISLASYKNWAWSAEDAKRLLPVTENETIFAFAWYNGEDKANYKNISQQILVTMVQCQHDTVFVTDVEPACTKAGTGHRYCEVCGIVTEKDIEISALGHSYGAPEFVWLEDFSGAEAVFTCQRDGCGDEETGHKKSVKAEVTAKRNGKVTVYTAEISYNGTLYTDTRQKPSDESTEKPSDESTEGPSDESTEKPSDESTEGPSDESTKKPNDESTERPSNESTEKPSNETAAASVNNKTDKKPESPATGDNKDSKIWILLLVLSTAELAGICYSKRKDSNH